MVYHRKTTSSLNPRNVERRRQRHFRKMVREDRILKLLLKNPEIAKRQILLEKVLWNFYMDAVVETVKLALHVTHSVVKRK